LSERLAVAKAQSRFLHRLASGAPCDRIDDERGHRIARPAAYNASSNFDADDVFSSDELASVVRLSPLPETCQQARTLQRA
jgi:hypothetical protein